MADTDVAPSEQLSLHLPFVYEAARVSCSDFTSAPSDALLRRHVKQTWCTMSIVELGGLGCSPDSARDCLPDWSA
jgi:hypothetical protein